MALVRAPGGAISFKHFNELNLPYSPDYRYELQNETLTSFGKDIISDAYDYIWTVSGMIHFINKYIDEQDPEDLHVVLTELPLIYRFFGGFSRLWENEDVQRILSDNESAKIYGEIEALVDVASSWHYANNNTLNQYVQDEFWRISHPGQKMYYER